LYSIISLETAVVKAFVVAVEFVVRVVKELDCRANHQHLLHHLIDPFLLRQVNPSLRIIVVITAKVVVLVVWWVKAGGCHLLADLLRHPVELTTMYQLP
jgi:hypothetical protein